MKQKITIAIDGYSSCGKSTLAKELAKELQYVFIDSGAMYRGVTLFALENKWIDGDNVNQKRLILALPEIQLNFKLNSETKSPELYLNGKNVSKEIRTPKVSAHVSLVASIKEVREKLVASQREMGKEGGIVMDGRDIGSVVFPNAELKLFVTASADVRTERRYEELIFKGVSITKEEVKANLLKRDKIDSTRKESPLIQTKDAIILDNTHLDREEQLKVALELVQRATKLV